jgi:hypothetical protein
LELCKGFVFHISTWRMSQSNASATASVSGNKNRGHSADGSADCPLCRFMTLREKGSLSPGSCFMVPGSRLSWIQVCCFLPPAAHVLRSRAGVFPWEPGRWPKGSEMSRKEERPSAPLGLQCDGPGRVEWERFRLPRCPGSGPCPCLCPVTAPVTALCSPQFGCPGGQ